MNKGIPVDEGISAPGGPEADRKPVVIRTDGSYDVEWMAAFNGPAGFRAGKCVRTTTSCVPAESWYDAGVDHDAP